MWAVKHPSYDAHFEYVKFNIPAIVEKFSNDVPLRIDSYLSIQYCKTCGYSLLFQFGQQKAVDSFWICVHRPHDGRFAASQKDAATSTIIAAQSPGFSKRFRSSQSSRVTWSVHTTRVIRLFSLRIYKWSSRREEMNNLCWIAIVRDQRRRKLQDFLKWLEDLEKW